MPPSRKRNEIVDINGAFSELGDTLKKISISPNINNYVPHPKQIKYHSSNAATRLYIGGNRSGKTTGGIVEDLWWLTGQHRYLQTPDPTYRPVMGRLVSVDFLNGISKIIIPKLKQWLPPSQLKGGSWYDAYSASERVLTLENGSQLELMSYDQDLDKFAGTDRDFVHFDEEPPQSIYTECMMRLIDRNGRSWITMTPVEGMTWMYDAVYEPGISGDKNISVIEVDTYENPYLPREAIERITSGLDDKEIEARIKGRFVQMGGLIYKAFDLDTHVIPEIDVREFQNRRKYKLYMSLDHGLNNPTSVHWHAVDNDGRVITFAEHYEAGKIIDHHAQVIHRKNNEHGRIPDINICDPALQQRNAVTGTSILTEYALRGIGFVTANNDVKTGIAKMSQYLEVREDGQPTWHITDNCGNFIREIRRYRWKTWASKKQQDQNNAYDEPHKKNDHAMDECRYFYTFMPELKHSPSVAKKKTIAEQMGSQAGTKGQADIWKRTDPNLTPEALAAAAVNRDGVWREVMDEEY